MSSTAVELRDYIVTQFLEGEDADDLTDSFDLVDSGVIDSLGLVRVISHISNAYEIPMDDIPIAPENFRSIEAMCTFISSAKTAV